jgi:hypothetical protein
MQTKTCKYIFSLGRAGFIPAIIFLILWSLEKSHYHAPSPDNTRTPRKLQMIEFQKFKTMFPFPHNLFGINTAFDEE